MGDAKQDTDAGSQAAPKVPKKKGDRDKSTGMTLARVGEKPE